jgi:REP element-mobilizing transposase RayT
MPHSFNKIWIHAIWATKERQPLIEAHAEKKIHDILREELREAGCPVRIVNGMADHVHLLFLLNPQKSVAEVIKQVKGSSSHTINQENLVTQKFAWQTGYAAYSVSESQLEKVFGYILNQKAHHSKQNFEQEYDEFIARHNIGETGEPG